MCNAQIGENCVWETDHPMFGSDSGHGMRMDDFCRDAPYEARLVLHLENVAAMLEDEELLKRCRQAVPQYDPRLESIFLSDDELYALI